MGWLRRGDEGLSGCLCVRVVIAKIILKHGVDEDDDDDDDGEDGDDDEDDIRILSIR